MSLLLSLAVQQVLTPSSCLKVDLTARNSESHKVVEPVKVAAAYNRVETPVRCQKAAQSLSSNMR